MQHPKKIKLLNLLAGIGGNTFKLDRKKYQITHIEHNESIAEECQLQNPNDIVIIDDAWEHVHNYNEFDYVWASPPCQTHTHLNNALHGQGRKRLPDLRLYALVIYLRHFVKIPWVVENVQPYYKGIINEDVRFLKPTAILSRHWYWSNYKIVGGVYKHSPNITNAGGIRLSSKEHREKLQEYLGITLKKLRYQDTHNPNQILSNCVHPDEGIDIIEQGFKIAKTWEDYF